MEIQTETRPHTSQVLWLLGNQEKLEHLEIVYVYLLSLLDITTSMKKSRALRCLYFITVIPSLGRDLILLPSPHPSMSCPQPYSHSGIPQDTRLLLLFDLDFILLDHPLL